MQRIAAGPPHGLAVPPDGTVLTWGWNNYGQLGDTDEPGRAPGRLPSPPAATGVSGRGSTTRQRAWTSRAHLRRGHTPRTRRRHRDDDFSDSPRTGSSKKPRPY
ncbi:hypothetical protein [Streptomyces tubercidicus]